MTLDHQAALLAAKRTFEMEAEAVSNLIDRLDDQFPRACELMLPPRDASS